MRWEANIQPVRACATSPPSLGSVEGCEERGERGDVDVWSLLCKMEMSLPRFAVARLFWNGSRRKTLGRAGKLGHLQGSRAAPSFGRRVAARATTEGLKRVTLFIYSGQRSTQI